MISPSGRVWLPELLRKEGYRTAGFHTHAYLRKENSQIFRAFSEYYDPSEEARLSRKKAKDLMHRKDERFSDFMYLDTIGPPLEDWLDKHRAEKFFLYAHIVRRSVMFLR